MAKYYGIIYYLSKIKMIKAIKNKVVILFLSVCVIISLFIVGHMRYERSILIEKIDGRESCLELYRKYVDEMTDGDNIGMGFGCSYRK